MIISNPEKPLNPAVEISKTDYYCRKIAPYILVLSLIVLSGLILFASVKYGANVTGTEANVMQRLQVIV